jgi:signal transduction histidine kinase
MFKKLILYAKLKEVRSAWAFFAFGLAYAVIFFTMLPAWIALILMGTVTGFLVYLVWAGINAAKTNFALKIEKNQNAAIIAGFSEGVIAYDQSFRIISMNQAAEAITGVRKEDILGNIVGPEWAADSRFKIIAQIMFPSLAPTVVKKTLTGWPQRAEVIITDPRELHLEISTNQIFDETGKLLGFIKVIRDRSREIALMRSKSEFITVAAHQMRTPLSGIRWALDSLKKGDLGALTPDQTQLVDQTLASVEKLIKLIDDLLNVSKIEEGKFGYSLAKQDLTALIREVLETLAQSAESRSVRLVLYPPAEEIPPLLIDRQKMATALQNIIENGIRYNVKNGEVRVSLERLKDQPYVEITIQDTGIGMPEKDVERLFTKFFRGEGAMRIETEGAGLGLYIAKNIIMRHGGDIRVKSVEKRGTTFTILLPTDESLVPPTEVPVGELL